MWIPTNWIQPPSDTLLSPHHPVRRSTDQSTRSSQVFPATIATRCRDRAGRRDRSDESGAIRPQDLCEGEMGGIDSPWKLWYRLPWILIGRTRGAFRSSTSKYFAVRQSSTQPVVIAALAGRCPTRRRRPARRPRHPAEPLPAWASKTESAWNEEREPKYTKQKPILAPRKGSP